MSHFYRQKSYTYNESDEMLIEIKKEMSNFITKEEAEESAKRTISFFGKNYSDYEIKEVDQNLINRKPTSKIGEMYEKNIHT